MPYELTFTRRVEPAEGEQYINPCCYGGDIVSEQLLPLVRAGYADIQANQEDWGWFIWFRDGAVKLAIDIVCDDPETGAFRIHLTSRVKRLLGSAVKDTPELDTLRDRVVAELTRWTGAAPGVERLDEHHM
jgi:hypothetical protein